MGKIRGFRVCCISAFFPLIVSSRDVFVFEFRSAGAFHLSGGGGGGIPRMLAAALVDVASVILSSLASPFTDFARELVAWLRFFTPSSWIGPLPMSRLAGFLSSDLR